MNLEKLFDSFPVDQIHWRVGATNGDKTKGIALAYLDARNVMERLDAVCGAGNWQVEYPFPGCCRIGINLQGGEPWENGQTWVWKSNGAGETDFEGTKGQYSDAFKRAAVLWGIGRYLYDLDAPWVEIEQRGRSYVIAKTALTKLESLLKSNHQFKPGEKDKIIEGVKSCLDNGDADGIRQIFSEYDGEDPAEKQKVWALFNSTERSTITELLK